MPAVDHHYQIRSPDHGKYLEKMIDWLDQHGKNLQRLSIQGGEPFLQKEFDSLMDWLETKRFPNLELSFNTNLNEKPGILDSYVERYKKMLSDQKLKRVDFNCSIDCWGPQQEFIRYGLDLSNWWRNFQFLLSNKWLHVHTGHTVTSLSIKYMPELLSNLNDLDRSGYRFYQTFGSVDGSTQAIYDPVFFGGDFFRDDLQSALNLITDPIGKKRFQGIATRILDNQPNLSGLTKLYITLDEIDRRRRTDWKSIFPEIHQFFIKNGIPNVV